MMYPSFSVFLFTFAVFLMVVYEAMRPALIRRQKKLDTEGIKTSLQFGVDRMRKKKAEKKRIDSLIQEPRFSPWETARLEHELDYLPHLDPNVVQACTHISCRRARG